MIDHVQDSPTTLFDYCLALVSSFTCFSFGADMIHSFAVAFGALVAKELIMWLPIGNVFKYVKKKFFDKNKH
jgi:hypothetical protein